MSPYQVKVEWDGEALVWVASSEEVPGLATGADTFDELIEKLKVVIPELLVENGLLPAGTDSVPFAVTAERAEVAPVADGRQFHAAGQGNSSEEWRHGKGDHESGTALSPTGAS